MFAIFTIFFFLFYEETHKLSNFEHDNIIKKAKEEWGVERLGGDLVVKEVVADETIAHMLFAGHVRMGALSGIIGHEKGPTSLTQRHLLLL